MKPFPTEDTIEAYQKFIDSMTDPEFIEYIDYAISNLYNDIQKTNQPTESKFLFRGTIHHIRQKMSDKPLNRSAMEPLFAELLKLYDQLIENKR